MKTNLAARIAPLALVAASVSALPAAHADSLGAEPNDPGKVTHIRKGVKEIDLGGMFVLSHNKSGDAASTRVQSLSGLGFQYFLKDNMSVGGNVLFNYDRQSSDSFSTAFGGTAFASLHVRLGLGAFLRPTLAGGLLVGKLNDQQMGGNVMTSSQIATLVRVSLPFAYFPSPRLVLQAGPELDVSLGVTTPAAGDRTTFTAISGGFGLSAGYAF